LLPIITEEETAMFRDRDRWWSKVIFFSTILSLALLAGACQGPQTAGPKPGVEGVQGGQAGKVKIMVMPFTDLSRIFGVETNIRNPITRRLFLSGPVPKQIPDYLTSKLVAALQKRPDVTILTSDQVVDYVGLQTGRSSLEEFRAHINRIATDAGAQKVMLGYVYRFRQRVGASLSVESPASVAYDILLLDVDGGRVLWQGYLDETQKSLSEDLTQIDKFLRRGASWMTAEDLASESIAHQIRSLRVQ
jgi:hypothetical protein